VKRKEGSKTRFVENALVSAGSVAPAKWLEEEKGEKCKVRIPAKSFLRMRVKGENSEKKNTMVDGSEIE